MNSFSISTIASRSSLKPNQIMIT